MTAGSLRESRSLLATALARAETFLFEPEEAPVALAPEPPRRRPVVAVVGLARACGTTTVARALAAELGARDAQGAAAVTGAAARGGPGPSGTAAARLARHLAVAAPGPCPPRTAGRLCLTACGDLATLTRATRHRAPLGIDVPCGEPAVAAASLADHVVLVAGAETVPALADAVGQSLVRAGPAPLLVVNRAAGPGLFEQRDPLVVPDSALAARLALAGRTAPGAFGVAIAALADTCGEPR